MINKMSGYILRKLDKEDLLKSKLKCEDCGKNHVYSWQYKINLFGPVQTTWWLCKECIKKRFNDFLEDI